jgi:phosphatidyl-myo-inositol dimannoside synthase
VKILYLTPGCFDKGGISRYARYQVRALRAILGTHNVRVLSLLGPDQDSFEEPFQIAFSAGSANISGKLRLSASALRHILAWSPDLIHVGHVNMSGLAGFLGRLGRARVLLNVYGLEVWSGFRPDARWGLANADFVLSDCHATANYLEGQGLRSKGSVEVVWDCVDLDRFTPGIPAKDTLAKYGIASPYGGVTLLTLGRMTRDTDHKGYTRLYDAFRRIAGRAPEARVIFAGRGDLAERLRTRCQEDGLGAHVLFTGGIHEADLPDIYRCADLFSLISDRGIGRGEGIPLTPLEAAACGVPILVGNQDGSREAVIEGLNGHILDPFDLDRQGEVFLSLIKDGDRRKAMGSSARKRIESEFSYPIFREKHRALLAQWLPDMRVEESATD